MSDCCSLAKDKPDSKKMAAAESPFCPACGEKGKRVDTQIVKAMLAISLEAVRGGAYRFCRTERCPVVYFSVDGVQTFGEADLRERVHQKHPFDEDVFVCYCFRHTPGDIRVELQATGESTVVERINAGIRAGKCACDIRNPQGDCCLGNVIKVVKRLQNGAALVAT
ncbi:MAG: hypothetical protein GXP42_08780 [Chloroflexi bacterium]|nr:hypothetical protein [Chloroflexota bacterium]